MESAVSGGEKPVKEAFGIGEGHFTVEEPVRAFNPHSRPNCLVRADLIPALEVLQEMFLRWLWEHSAFPGDDSVSMTLRVSRRKTGGRAMGRKSI